MTRTLGLILITTFLLSVTGCMKTRGQVKTDDDETTETEYSKMPRYRGERRSDSEEIANEVMKLSGRLDEIERKGAASSAEPQGNLKQTLDRIEGRLVELEKNHILIMSEIKTLKDGNVSTTKALSTPTSQLLEEAQQLLEDKKYDEAEERFKLALNKAGKGKEAAEAAHGMGESQYGLKKYKDSILAYSKVQELFSKSPLIPASLYKIGLSFQHMNMQSEANNFFKVILERYSKSPEAKKAKSRIKE